MNEPEHGSRLEIFGNLLESGDMDAVSLCYVDKSLLEGSTVESIEAQ
jgi:hypothetical protein